MPFMNSAGSLPAEPAPAIASRPHLSAATACALVAILGIAVLAERIGFGQVDDAYITFRYARNVAAGNGLCFNPPERVEGYSNFVWMMLLAGAARGGLDIPTVAVALGGLLLLPLFLVSAALARQVLSASDRAWGGLAAGILASAHPGIVYYAVGGLETISHALLVTAAVLVALRVRSRRTAAALGAICVLAAMSRPEGMLVGIVAASALWAAGRRARPGHAGASAAFAAVWLLGVGSFVAWRYVYFGDWLPNSCRAKLVPMSFPVLQTGVLYSAEFFVGSLVVLAAPLWLAWCSRRDRAWSMALVVAVLLHTACAVRAGGDWMPMMRLYLPVWPLCAVAMVQVLCAARERPRPSSACGGSGAGVVGYSLVVLATIAGVAYRFEFKGLPARTVDNCVLAGRWLSSVAKPNESVACTCLGVVAYYWDGPAYDMFGLTDRHIARSGDVEPRRSPGHRRSDVLYTCAQRPTYIVINGKVWDYPVGEQEFENSMHAWRPFARLLASHDFRSSYQYVVGEVAPGRYLGLYARVGSALVPEVRVTAVASAP